MNHIDSLLAKKADVKTLGDVFSFLKELQEIDRVWETIQDHLQNDIAGSAAPDATIPLSVLDDVKTTRTLLSTMEKEMQSWQVTTPTLPKKTEKPHLPMPRDPK